MEHFTVNCIAALTLSVAALGTALAEGSKNEQILGLWQSGDTYLELNLDGTFFCAEQAERDDIFGTFIVQGDVVHFTYGSEGAVVTMQKKMRFAPTNENTMQLVDSQQQSLHYRKLRDF